MWFLRLSPIVLAVLAVACRNTAQPPAAAPAAAPQPATANAVAEGYEGEIRQFQHDREAALTADNGWLTIAGLFFLTQPRTTFGSDPLNDIVLPAGAPARAGTFELVKDKVTVKAEPGV